MLMQQKAPSFFWRNARTGVAHSVLLGVLLIASAVNPVQAAPALPYGSYNAERQMVLEQLPCKWISMHGRDGIRRDDSGYDFLCKGGVWATVSLMMDESKLQRDGIGRVRLLFREWPAEIHPGGGEAYVAQEFLQYVIAHFVPANLAENVQEAYWNRKDRSWKLKGLTLTIAQEDMGNHIVRRLEIAGNVGAVTPMVTMPVKTSTTKAVAAPAAQPVIVPLPVAAEPVQPMAIPVTQPAVAAPEHKGWGRFFEAKPERVVVVTPTEVMMAPKTVKTVTKVETVETTVGSPTVIAPAVLPMPAKAASPAKEAAEEKAKEKKSWRWLFNPADHAAETSGPAPLPKSVPVTAPAAVTVQTPLIVPSTTVAPVVGVSASAVSVTTPPVFADQPAPESLIAPTPPPAVSDTLVPSTLDRTLGRASAPSNFDAYNQAEALTRQYEVQAMDAPNDKPKVTAGEQAAQDTGLMKAPESKAVAPALAPVPTPGVAEPMSTPTPTSAGLLKNETPAAEPMVVPTNDPRFVPERPMPQLKFVPKAQPVGAPDGVIRFEDEKSGL